MQFQLNIDLDNAAFYDENEDISYSAEVARILRLLADSVENHPLIDFEKTLRDVNGNPVGKATVSR